MAGIKGRRAAAGAVLAAAMVLTACSTAVVGDPQAATTVPPSTSASAPTTGETSEPTTTEPTTTEPATEPTTTPSSPTTSSTTDTSSTSTPPPTTSTSAELPPSGTPSPMIVTDQTIARPKVPSSGAVTIPLTTLPKSYDVNSAESPGYLTEVAALTQPSVYFVDPLGAVALDTDVVEKVQLNTSDPQTVEYHINPKATWSDGVPLSCQDFYLAWLANVSNAENKDGAYAFDVIPTGLYSQIKSIKCSDGGSTVTAVFDSPSASWQNLFAGLLPAHVAAEQAKVSDITSISPSDTKGAVLKVAEAYNKAFGTIDPDTALSAGPYVVTAASGSAIELERNPKWWGNPAGPSEIRLIQAPADAALQALRSGSADVVSVTDQNPDEKLPDIDGTTRTNQVWPVSEHIEFNVRKKLFQGKAGKALREAVFSCIDRSKIVDVVAKAVNPDAEVLGNLFVAPWQDAYTDHYQDFRTADPAAAKKLMQQGGWKLNKDGVFERGKTTAQFTLSTLPRPHRKQIVAMVQSQCKKAGISIKSKDLQATDIYTNKYEAALFAWAAPILPADYWYTYASGSGQNTSGYDNPKVDELLNALRSDVKPRDESSTLNKIDELIAKDYVVLPLFDWSAINYQRDEIHTQVMNNYFWGGPVWDAYAWAVED